MTSEAVSQGSCENPSGYSLAEIDALRDTFCDLTYDERRALAADPSPLAQRIRAACA